MEIERLLGIEPEEQHRPPEQPPRIIYMISPGMKEEIRIKVEKCRRKLSWHVHPDRGGSTEAMQAVNSALDDLIRQI
jgi:hypothetical protein